MKTRAKRLRKKISLHNPPNYVDTEALIEVVKYFYKGKRDIEIKFDNRLHAYGQQYIKDNTYIIEISPDYCKHQSISADLNFKKLIKKSTLIIMSDEDTITRIIQVLLHEIKHCIEHEKNPQEFIQSLQEHNNDVQNPGLKYEFCRGEALAEGWSLINLHKAMKVYRNDQH